MRFLKRSIVGLFLLSVTVALLAWAGNTVRSAVEARMNAEPRSFPQRERVFAVNVVRIEPQTIAPELQVFGELQSRRTLELRSATGGTVVEASDDLIEGGEVTEGQVLVRIDPASAQAARDRSAADRQDAEAELRDAERAMELAADELAAAQEQAELRQQALTRARDLEERGVGTAAAVESAELAASSANAAILTRRQAVANAEARRDQATTRLARARINLEEAERALTDTVIRAPFAGVLSEVSISPGGRLSPNERFGALLDAERLEASFRLSTSQYARLLGDAGTPVGAPVSVSLDVADVDLRAEGRVTRESASVGSGQTGRLLFAELDSAPGFRPGDFVTVTIIEPALEDVAIVPATAVAADNTVLRVNAENRLEQVATRILRRQGDDVIIPAADLAGAEIVAERSPLLGAGIGVRPIRPGGAEEAAAEPEMVALDPERRERLKAFVEGSRMPDEAKTRILAQLDAPEVPTATINRLESRMGG